MKWLKSGLEKQRNNPLLAEYKQVVAYGIKPDLSHSRSRIEFTTYSGQDDKTTNQLNK